ncbi:MAG: DnaJ domain-containing protein [Hymenobacter sp.]
MLDEAALKAKYYQLSRELHPDFHAQDNPAAQAEALRLSTLNTDAYRTLADPDARMAYLLRPARPAGRRQRPEPAARPTS